MVRLSETIQLTDPFCPGFGEEGDLAFALEPEIGESETDASGLGREVGEAAPLVLSQNEFPAIEKELV